MNRKFLYLLVLIVAAIALAANECDDGPTQPPPGGQCGTVAGIACPAAQFCELPAGECQTADLAGVCKIKPEICTQQYDPVCGCDGVTYGNDCMRMSVGVQKAHDGECS